MERKNSEILDFFLTSNLSESQVFLQLDDELENTLLSDEGSPLASLKRSASKISKAASKKKAFEQTTAKQITYMKTHV